MNKKTAAKLLGLMEVKTQLEKAGHAVIKGKQKQTLDKADALLRNAASAHPSVTDDHSSVGLRHAAAYSAHLLSDARQMRREAAALEVKKQEKQNQLRAALQREMAAERLLKEAQLLDRKRFETKEEISREQNLTAHPTRR